MAKHVKYLFIVICGKRRASDTGASNEVIGAIFGHGPV